MAGYPGDRDPGRWPPYVPRDYTGPAVLTLILYFFFWLPGLVANLIFWHSASRDQSMTGRAPVGKGCLVALFLFFVVLPFLSLCLLVPWTMTMRTSGVHLG